MLICRRCFKKDNELEGCIDDERQFKMAKRSQAPGDFVDDTVLKRFFHFSLWIEKNSILESVNFLRVPKFSIFVMVT